MRNVWVFAMDGSEKDPSNAGTWESWFLYYKWEVGGEVWLPVSSIEGIKDPVLAGDSLWLLLHHNDKGRSELLGLTKILRLEENHTTGKWEVWYDDDTVQRVPENRRVVDWYGVRDNTLLQPVHLEMHKEWMKKLNGKAS